MWKRNKTNTVLPGPDPLLDKLALRIARAGIKLQTQFSSILSKKADRLSTRSLKLTALFFTVVWIAASIYVIETALTNKYHQSSFDISYLKTPALVRDRHTPILNSTFTITDEEFAEMQIFRKYMDSLQQSFNPAYDSIISARPGLMDSVRLLEQLYNHQKK